MPSAAELAERLAETAAEEAVAEEVVRSNVQVNILGTNFMDFPEFLRATGGNDPEVRKLIELDAKRRQDLETLRATSVLQMWKNNLSDL